VHDLAERVLRELTRLADDAVPDLIDGVYVVGSLALDDFHEDSSDIDFVGLLNRRPSPEQLAALADVHRTLTQRFPRPYVDGLYLTRSDLAAGPNGCAETPSVHEHSFEAASRFGHDPVTWHTLATRGLVASGVPLTQLDIWTHEQRLRDGHRRSDPGRYTLNQPPFAPALPARRRVLCAQDQ
jgi:hypothetical protein